MKQPTDLVVDLASDIFWGLKLQGLKSSILDDLSTQKSFSASLRTRPAHITASGKVQKPNAEWTQLQKQQLNDDTVKITWNFFCYSRKKKT